MIQRHSILIVLVILLHACAGEIEQELENSDSSKDGFQTELEVESTEFEISNLDDTIIFGEQGTGIFIDSNSFKFHDGSTPEGPIKISIKEYYDMSDILIQDLSTMSDEGLLETGGMINLSVKSAGENLTLKEGKELVVFFPKNGNKNEMELFSGWSNSQGQINWSKEKTSKGYVQDEIWIWYIKYPGLDDSTLFLADNRTGFDWIEEAMVMTKSEQDYVMYKDINLYYTVTKNGDMIDQHFKKDVDKKFEKRMLKIVEKIPKLKPYTVNGNPIDMEGHFEYKVNVVPPSYGKNKNYLKQIEANYSEFESKSISDLDKTELHYYIFNSAKLGWLNCDRFVNDPAPKVDMSLNVDDPEGIMVKLIYKDYKSVIPARIVDKTHLFKQIPSGKDVTLLLIRYGKNEVKMAISEFKTKAGEIIDYKFKDYTMGELKKELQKLN